MKTKDWFSLRRQSAPLLLGMYLLAQANLIPSTLAQVKTWVGASGDWTTGTDWSPAGAPTAFNDAIISNGGTALITSSVTARSLTLGQSTGTSGTAGIGAGVVLTATGSTNTIGFNGSGTLALSSGGNFNFGGTVGATAFVLGLGSTSSGIVTINGTARLFGTGDAIIANAATSVMTLNNGGTFQAPNLVLGNNPGTQTGTLNVLSTSQVFLTGGLIAGSHANGVVNVDGLGSLVTSTGAIIGSTGIGAVHLTN